MAGSRRAVFLDRDDTLCRDVPYCSRPEDLHLLPGAGKAVARLNDAGFSVIVITNQSGIARGWIDEKMLGLIHEKMKRDLATFDAKVDGIYHCPHVPEDNCACRKPKPTLVERAARDFDVRLDESYMVGDRLMDVQLARNAGTKAVLVTPPKPTEEFEQARRLADHSCPSLADAVEWILSQERK